MCKTKQAPFEQKYNNCTNTIPWLDPTCTGCIFIADIDTTEDPFDKTNPRLKWKPGRGDNSAHDHVEWNHNDPGLAAFQKFSIPQAQSPWAAMHIKMET